MSVTDDHTNIARDARGIPTSEPDPEARRLRRELFADDLVDELLARAGEWGVALTGKGGSLPEPSSSAAWTPS